MILTLPTPVKDATHAVINQVTIDLEHGVAFVRVSFGTSTEGAAFMPDPDLAERCCVFEGAEYEALYGALDATPFVGALNARGWAARVDPPPPAPEPEAEDTTTPPGDD